MQTFLPYPTFAASARVLDDKRLNNQINEALIIWRTLTGYYSAGKGWPNHACTRMWQGYEDALAMYHNACLLEYEYRKGAQWKRHLLPRPESVPVPPWLGDLALHASHRSNLLRKDPVWYGQFGWAENPDLSYIWPAV